MLGYFRLRYNIYQSKKEISQIKTILEEYKVLNGKLCNIKNVSRDYKKDDVNNKKLFNDYLFKVQDLY